MLQRLNRIQACTAIISVAAVVILFVFGGHTFLGDSPTEPAQAEGWGAQGDSGAASVASVNGIPVTLKEFLARMPGQRSAALSYYQQAYGCDTGAAGFWTSPCGGEIPLQRLKRMTLDELVENRVRELAAQEAGLDCPVGYDAFLAAWKAENRQRSRRLAEGGVVYGPREYSEQVYYRYLASVTANDLKRWLAGRDGPFAEKLLREEYAKRMPGQSGSASFDEVREQLERLLEDERYDLWLAALKEQAEVKVNKTVYDAAAI
ncbi:SurA N-terminal domain-containing protein [Paenibacillus sp. S150]|uniref:SurA N-terminal domain-containing protein n=1 Tax=Paenibacillus sp. S150 TaxID=2749826 RepID=UPI001C59A2C5|nr:SurA N-terminal domain-containing protein [Paenibacillus sp. S150]MBW4083215.1 hypothetical protein [Paenibacillus sp. S150]